MGITNHEHRESSYLRAYKAPLHLSRVLYKFTPFYAKQTQFRTKSNVYNRSLYNQLQQKMNNGNLVKTKPIQSQYEPNQSQLKPIKANFKPKTNPIYGEQSRTTCRGVLSGVACLSSVAPVLHSISEEGLAKEEAKTEAGFEGKKTLRSLSTENFCGRKQPKTGIDVNEQD